MLRNQQSVSVFRYAVNAICANTAKRQTQYCKHSKGFDAVNATRGLGETCVLFRCFDVAIPAMLQHQQLFRCFVLCLRHCFGFVSTCSNHVAMPAMSWGPGWDSTASTSRLWRRATNFDKSLPENVMVRPSCFISCCDSWMNAQSKPVILSSLIHFAI